MKRAIIVVAIIVFVVIVTLTNKNITDAEIKVAKSIWSKYGDIIDYNATIYIVPAAVVAAVIATESGGVESRKGAAGEIGLMQLLPQGAIADWLRFNGYPDIFINGLKDFPDELTNYFEPAQNIKVGTWYLAQLYDKYGSWDKAFNAYNSGRATGDQVYVDKVNNWIQVFENNKIII
jgi:soluble lytic murein transglycosylase-like protein